MNSKDLVTVNGSLDSKHAIECQYTKDLVRDIKGYEYRSFVTQKLDESGWKTSPQKDYIVKEVCRAIVNNFQLYHWMNNQGYMGANVSCGSIPTDLYNITFDENVVGVGPGEVAMTLLFKNCKKSDKGDIIISNNYFNKNYIAEIKGFCGRLGKNGDGDIKSLIKNCIIEKDKLLELTIDNISWPSRNYIKNNQKIKKLYNMINNSIFDFDKIDFPGIRNEFRKETNKYYYSEDALSGFVSVFSIVEMYANAYTDVSSKTIGESKKLKYYLMSNNNSIYNDYDYTILELLKFNSDAWPPNFKVNKLIKQIKKILSKDRYYKLCGNGKISEFLIKLGTCVQLYSYWLVCKFDSLIVFNKTGTSCLTILIENETFIQNAMHKMQSLSVNTGISRNNGFGLCLS
jgi:hypothetical protein